VPFASHLATLPSLEPHTWLAVTSVSATHCFVTPSHVSSSVASHPAPVVGSHAAPTAAAEAVHVPGVLVFASAPTHDKLGPHGSSLSHEAPAAP
jgi:hypothetical protein